MLAGIAIKLPWSTRSWALPFMTILAPSKKFNQKRNRPHKTSIDWTILAMRVITRWLKRAWILIGDGGFACIRLAHNCVKKNVTLISRLRLDSALYEFPVTPEKIKRGRRREKGKRCQSLKPLSCDASQPWQEIEVNWYGDEKKKVRILSGIHLWYSAGEKPLPIRWVLVADADSDKAEAFFSTDLQLLPAQIINWFILRWNIEVTFEETRAHLGIETQRQWSPKAIARTTPSLMTLFSLTCLFALEMLKSKTLPIRSTAWYDKNGEAAFSDIIVFNRRSIWSRKYFDDSTIDTEYMKIKLPVG